VTEIAADTAESRFLELLDPQQPMSQHQDFLIHHNCIILTISSAATIFAYNFPQQEGR